MVHDGYTVAGQQFVPGLFQRERPVPSHLLKPRRGCAYAVFEITEEQLVCAVYPLRYVLDGLRAKTVPKTETLCFLEFRDMPLQTGNSYALPKAAIVSPMQGNEVIVDAPSNIDFAV
jgi:hypothetical protein